MRQKREIKAVKQKARGHSNSAEELVAGVPLSKRRRPGDGPRKEKRVAMQERSLKTPKWGSIENDNGVRTRA